MLFLNSIYDIECTVNRKILWSPYFTFYVNIKFWVKLIYAKTFVEHTMNSLWNFWYALNVSRFNCVDRRQYN